MGVVVVVGHKIEALRIKWGMHLDFNSPKKHGLDNWMSYKKGNFNVWIIIENVNVLTKLVFAGNQNMHISMPFLFDHWS